jgi:hypothetical protein
VHKHLSCSKFPATVPPKTRQSIRSSDHLKDNLGSHQIHHSERINPSKSIHPSLSNIVNSEASRTSNQENRNSNKKQNQQKMTTTPLPNPRLNPRPLPKHGNRQRRQSLQASLSRRRLNSNGDASLRWAITPGTQLKPHF